MLALKKDEPPEIFREAIIHREWGHRFFSLANYPLALEYFNKSKAEDLRTQLILCKTLIKNAKYVEAKELSEKCVVLSMTTLDHVQRNSPKCKLKIQDPDHYKARYIRMHTYFHLGKFGYSLADAYTGMRQHKMTFEYGIYKGNAAIENCIGRNTSLIALLLLYPWIKKLYKHRELLISKLIEVKEEELDDFPENNTRFKVNDPEMQQQMKLRKIQRVIAKMYLGFLAFDKNFFNDILNHPQIIMSANPTSNLEILTLATVISQNILDEEEILRKRRPIYVTLFKRLKIPDGHKRMIEQEQLLNKNLIVIEADFMLRFLHTMRINKNYYTFFSFIDRVRDKFESYPKWMFPLKQKCLTALYKMVAWVYIDSRNLMHLDNEEIKTRYLKHHLGIRVAILPRDVDIAWIPSRKGKETFNKFRRRLGLAYAPLDLVWVHHEFSMFLISIRRFNLARFYMKKGLEYAEKAKFDPWLLNIYHLVLRMEICQNNRNEAKDAALSALEYAKKLNIDCLIDFYKRAVDLIDVLDGERLNDFDYAIIAREQLILKIIPQDTRGEMNFLWRRMNFVPSKRRFCIMPGCKPIDWKFKIPCKRKSILPYPRKDMEKEAKIALLKQYAAPLVRPGFVDFEEF